MTIEKNSDVQQRVEQMNQLPNYIGRTVLVESVSFGSIDRIVGTLKSVTPFDRLAVKGKGDYANELFLSETSAVRSVSLYVGMGHSPIVLYDNTKNVPEGFDLRQANEALLDLEHKANHNDVPLSRIIDSAIELTLEMFEKSFGPEAAAKEAQRLWADRESDVLARNATVKENPQAAAKRLDALRRIGE